MLILREGDYVPDGKGGFRSAHGAEEVLERILWKLTVRRGSFPFLPELGSDLALLSRASAKERETLAEQYARQALADEAVTLRACHLRYEDEGAFLTLFMDWEGQELTATVEVGGLA